MEKRGLFKEIKGGMKQLLKNGKSNLLEKHRFAKIIPCSYIMCVTIKLEAKPVDSVFL